MIDASTLNQTNKYRFRNDEKRWYALKMGKEICVSFHRIGESNGTNKLLGEGFVNVIYDVDTFVVKFGAVEENNIVRDCFLD